MRDEWSCFIHQPHSINGKMRPPTTLWFCRRFRFVTESIDTCYPSTVMGINHFYRAYSWPWWRHPMETFSALLTVGQRKKVTAVTFFPERPRLDQTAQIRAKYTKFPWMKSRDIQCIEWLWLDLSRVQIAGSQCAWFGRYGNLKFSRGRR